MFRFSIFDSQLWTSKKISMSFFYILAFIITNNEETNLVRAIEVAEDYSINPSTDQGTLLSLSTNILGTCLAQIEWVSDVNDIRHAEIKQQDIISITSFPPSKTERSHYNRITETLTRVNPALIEGKVMGKSRVPAWFEMANNWQLPESHPRNNKTRCYAATVIAGKEVSSFYKVMRKETSHHYLIRTRNALIHGTGEILLFNSLFGLSVQSSI